MGIVLMVAPFLLRFALPDGVDFSTEALIACAALGVVAATLGFSGTRGDRDPSGGSHSTFDPVLCVALIAATLAFAARGELEAVLALGAAALAYAVLALFTRYTPRP